MLQPKLDQITNTYDIHPLKKHDLVTKERGYTSLFDCPITKKYIYL